VDVDPPVQRDGWAGDPAYADAELYEVLTGEATAEEALTENERAGADGAAAERVGRRERPSCLGWKALSKAPAGVSGTGQGPLRVRPAGLSAVAGAAGR